MRNWYRNGMRKVIKTQALLFMVILLCFNYRYVLAGDAFFHVYTNQEPQDALFIGKVVGRENENVLRMEVLRVVCGEIEDSEIKYYDPVVAKISFPGKVFTFIGRKR